MIAPDQAVLPAQWDLVKDGAMEMLECAMHPELPPEVHALGSEMATYLSASNPKNRAYIGLIPGVLKELVTMVHNAVHFDNLTDVHAREAENAAEALAILSKADVGNNEELSHTTAAADLADMVERSDGGVTPKGKMWAAAALGNLMSEFDDPAIKGFAQAVQQALAARENFTHTLVELTREARVHANDTAEEMPATASRTNASRTYPHLGAWAAMHAAEHMALNAWGLGQLKAEPGAQELFCDLAMSPDSLERMKAEAILLVCGWGCQVNNFRLARRPGAGKAGA